MLIISETFVNLSKNIYTSYKMLTCDHMSMMFGCAWGCYCLRLTQVQIRFVFDDKFVS